MEGNLKIRSKVVSAGRAPAGLQEGQRIHQLYDEQRRFQKRIRERLQEKKVRILKRKSLSPAVQNLLDVRPPRLPVLERPGSVKRLLAAGA